MTPLRPSEDRLRYIEARLNEASEAVAEVVDQIRDFRREAGRSAEVLDETETLEASEEALRLAFEESQQTQRGPGRDHYVEKPFLDPFDCFEEEEPALPFPEDGLDSTPGNSASTPAPLSGLFRQDPEVRRERNRGVTEIQFGNDGAYHLRFLPLEDSTDHDTLSS